MIPNTWVSDEPLDPPAHRVRPDYAWVRRLTFEQAEHQGILRGNCWPDAPWPGWRFVYALTDIHGAVYALTPLHLPLKLWGHLMRWKKSWSLYGSFWGMALWCRLWARPKEYVVYGLYQWQCPCGAEYVGRSRWSRWRRQ